MSAQCFIYAWYRERVFKFVILIAKILALKLDLDAHSDKC